MSEDEEVEEAPKRRRRKRRPADEPAAPATESEAENEAENEAQESAPPAAATKPEVPAFAAHFPRDPELDALVAAFEAGDYARVRREAPALAKRTDRDDVRAAARELAKRLDPDPLAVTLLGLAAALLVFLAGWYWLHDHAH